MRALGIRSPMSAGVAYYSVPCRILYWVARVSLAQPRTQTAFNGPASCHFGNSKQSVCCPWSSTPSGIPRPLELLSFGLASTPELCYLTQLSVGSIVKDKWGAGDHTEEI